MQQKLVALAASVRRLSHELHPSVLQHSGLAAALEAYCGEFAALTSHRISFRLAKVPPLRCLHPLRSVSTALPRRRYKIRLSIQAWMRRKLS